MLFNAPRRVSVVTTVLLIVITVLFARRCCSNYNRPTSPARRAHSSKPAVAGVLLWARAGTDTRTDSVPLHRPCCARTECWWTASAVVWAKLRRVLGVVEWRVDGLVYSVLSTVGSRGDYCRIIIVVETRRMVADSQ